MILANSPADAGRREYVLSEFRCAIARAKLAQLEMESTALALQHHIVTPEQAAAMFWDTEASRFLGLTLGQEASS